jgi:mRNA interferase RelE/StbE
MAFYKILFRESIHKDLRHIPQNDVKRIFERIDLLAVEPRPYGCEKLIGYRIVYSIQDKELVIWIVKIGHRKDVYR